MKKIFICNDLLGEFHGLVPQFFYRSLQNDYARNLKRNMKKLFMHPQ